MTMHDQPDKPVRDEDLVAYAEGRLPAGSGLRARVEAHLHRQPADAARVQSYQRQDALIREAFGDIAREPIPDRLVPGSVPDDGGRPWAALGMAAMLVVGIALGWLGARVTATDVQQPAVQGFAEHVADRLTTSTGAGATEATAPADGDDAPDLSAAGLRALGHGGAADDRGTRRFDYRDADGNTIHLFVSPDIASTTPSVRTLEAGDYTLAYWHQDDATYVVGGHVPGNRLVGIARSVRQAVGSGAQPVVTEPPATATAEPAEEVIAVTPDSGSNGGNGTADVNEGGADVAVPDQM